MVGLCSAATLVLAGCGSDLAVTPPEPDDASATTCRRLVAELPATLNAQPQRTTDPRSPLTAAWGTPGIALRCGVAEPDAYDPTAQLITVNGVDWFPEEYTEGYVFTTWGREVRVEVAVPDDYAPEVNPLVDLAPVIKQHNPAMT